MTGRQAVKPTCSGQYGRHSTSSRRPDSDLSVALADHRRAMLVREEIRLAGGNWDAARAESHLTRSAVTAPLLRVRLLLPEATVTAQHAV